MIRKISCSLPFVLGVLLTAPVSYALESKTSFYCKSPGNTFYLQIPVSRIIALSDGAWCHNTKPQNESFNELVTHKLLSNNSYTVDYCENNDRYTGLSANGQIEGIKYSFNFSVVKSWMGSEKYKTNLWITLPGDTHQLSFFQLLPKTDIKNEATYNDGSYYSTDVIRLKYSQQQESPKSIICYFGEDN